MMNKEFVEEQKRAIRNLLIGALTIWALLWAFSATAPRLLMGAISQQQRPPLEVSTSIAVAQTYTLASGAGHQFGCVVVSSGASAASQIIIFDTVSSTATAQRLLEVSGGTLGTYCNNEVVDLGITYQTIGTTRYTIRYYPTPTVGGTR